VLLGLKKSLTRWYDISRAIGKSISVAIFSERQRGGKGMVITEPPGREAAVMSAEHFAGRLRELREQAQLSQAELARKAGISQGVISDWERAKKKPLWENVVALAEALGVDVAEFLKPPAKRPPAGRGRPRKGKPGPKGRGRKRGG
jgi:DNA-binding XRE family transcriptional regulator